MAFKNFFNDLFSTTGEENGEAQENENEQVKEESAPAPEQKPEKTRRPAPAQNQAQTSAPRAASMSNALELKICKPQSFAEVGGIADHLLNRCTVVLNLETTSKETARRIVDFLNGVAYSIDGQIKPVANNTFVLTPKTVSVTGEESGEEPEEPLSEDNSYDNF